MSTEADFSPPHSAAKAQSPHEASFPISSSLNIVFSAYEDRLVVRCTRVNRAAINVLLTRRMTIIVLSQLLANLPELSGLDKTPAQYWQEVLQMAHQNALQAGRNSEPESKSESAAAAASALSKGAATPAADKKPSKVAGAIYLATSLTTQLREGELVLAISGLPMPSAMTKPCEREPLFAVSLQVEHAHQLIQLLIDKSQEADWHLPVNLPWLESPAEPQGTTLGMVH